jgi:drug/metabolite transporter (DMT)-like permease
MTTNCKSGVNIKIDNPHRPVQYPSRRIAGGSPACIYGCRRHAPSVTGSPMNRAHALLLLILTALFWSLGGLMIKKVNLHPLAIAGWRSAIAVVGLLMWTRKPKITWSLPQIGCAAAYAGNMFSFIAATKLTTAANAILLQYTAPAYVAVLGIWLLREYPRPIDWLAVVLTLSGMVLFFFDRISLSGLWGNVCGVVSGITFAGLILLLRKQKEGTPVVSVILGNALTAVLAIPWMIRQVPANQDWLWLVLLGSVQTAVPYILYSMAIRHVTALEGTLVPVIEPLLNPTWAFLFLGEIPGFWAMLGGVVILAAVTMRSVVSSTPDPT